MKIVFSLLFGLLMFPFVGNALSNNKAEPAPSDSTSSIVDRAAAVYMIDEGKKMLFAGRLLDAMREFRKAYVRDENNARAVYWIGETHYRMNNYGYAIQYGELSKKMSKEEDGDIYFLLAQAYHQNNDLNTAKEYYDKVAAVLSVAKRDIYDFKHHQKEIEKAISFETIPRKYEKKLLSENISSGYNDYAALFTKGGKEVYFVSRRPDTKGGNINPADQQYFEDIYISQWDEEEQEWTLASNDVERLNSEGFDAIGYISEDESTAYLTVNTSVLDQKNTTRSSDICVAKKTDKGAWSTPRIISNKTINTSYFDGSPTLTSDESTMYFVSDRNGSKTMSDIYVVHREGGKWGKAERLPDNVNTKMNETTPFVTGDGKYLFFSSDGHEGIGGYDIYITENLGNNKWSDPVNLGPDFNTVNDDIYFRYFPALEKALMSNYRVQGKKSSMDIFEIVLPEFDFNQFKTEK